MNEYTVKTNFYKGCSIRKHSDIILKFLYGSFTLSIYDLEDIKIILSFIYHHKKELFVQDLDLDLDLIEINEEKIKLNVHDDYFEENSIKKENDKLFLETSSCGVELSFEILPNFVSECLKVQDFFTDKLKENNIAFNEMNSTFDIFTKDLDSSELSTWSNLNSDW